MIARWGWIVAVLALVVAVEEWRISDSERDLATAHADVATLTGAVAAQNAEIVLFAATARATDATAIAAARRVLLDGARTRPLTDPTGHGPEEMNRWLTETFR